DALSELKDGSGIGATVSKVRFHSLELAAVRRERPGSEVVELLIDIVANGTMGILPALRFENANRDTLPFNGMILFVNRNQVFVEQDYGGRFPDGGGRRRLDGGHGPIRRRLRFIPGKGGAGAGPSQGCNRENENRKRARSVLHQLPFAAGDTARTSCC